MRAHPANSRGSILVEYCLAALPMTLILGGALGLLLLVILRYSMDAEAFLLARAHLYGNRQSECKAQLLEQILSSPHGIIKIQGHCSFYGRVKLEALFHEQKFLTREWNLEKGNPTL